MVIHDNTSIEIGARIKQVRQSQHMTQKNFANSLGIVQGFLCSIERGNKKPSNTLLVALLHLYAISSSWLCSGIGEMKHLLPPESEIAASGAANIPLLRNPANYSFPGTAENDIIGYISLPGTPNNSFAIEYSGDFMSPTIRDGDIVIITPDSSPTPGKIALIMGKWGEPFLRRYRSRNGEIFYTADNSAYSPFKPDTETTILGMVAMVWRKVNF